MTASQKGCAQRRPLLPGRPVEGSDIVDHRYAGEVSRWTLSSPQDVIRACRDLQRCAKVKPW